MPESRNLAVLFIACRSGDVLLAADGDLAAAVCLRLHVHRFRSPWAADAEAER